MSCWSSCHQHRDWVTNSFILGEEGQLSKWTRAQIPWFLCAIRAFLNWHKPSLCSISHCLLFNRSSVALLCVCVVVLISDKMFKEADEFLSDGLLECCQCCTLDHPALQNEIICVCFLILVPGPSHCLFHGGSVVLFSWRKPRQVLFLLSSSVVTLHCLLHTSKCWNVLIRFCHFAIFVDFFFFQFLLFVN